VERFGRIKERHSTHKADMNAVAPGGHHQPKLLFNLGCSQPILSWSSVEAEPSTAQAGVVLHRDGPSPLSLTPSIPAVATTVTNRSPVCYVS
jgi:hypothetical protein